jgi:transcriptional regulator with XRE-family HTH domain
VPAKKQTKLRKWRFRLNLLQSEAADLLGITVRHYGRLEREECLLTSAMKAQLSVIAEQSKKQESK